MDTQRNNNVYYLSMRNTQRNNNVYYLNMWNTQRNNNVYYLSMWNTQRNNNVYYLSTRNNVQVLALCRNPDNSALRKSIIICFNRNHVHIVLYYWNNFSLSFQV